MAMDPQLETVIGYLVGFQERSANGAFGAEQRPWMDFKEVREAGKFDFAAVHEIFTRARSNDDYANVRSNPQGLGRELQTAKLSADYLAGFERDYRMLRRSRIRMIVHAGNRAAGNGNAGGPLQRNTIDWLGRINAEDAR